MLDRVVELILRYAPYVIFGGAAIYFFFVAGRI